MHNNIYMYAVQKFINILQKNLYNIDYIIYVALLRVSLNMLNVSIMAQISSSSYLISLSRDSAIE